ncbi:hypothetical protein CK203_022541 [Vitis vinifera]|uniref:Uncharacterized protein n=1 Tax=Vitis vinifera TaxID=29760 RepID=A0A438JE58_VITVI|nr:hypothetical protein CK203_022541 [Vitis vinifera]
MHLGLLNFELTAADMFFMQEDQKVVKKRKTELGGTFSIASWILFIGLFAALLYQIISKRSIEYDLFKFAWPWNFGYWNPGFLDYRVLPLSTIVSYFCQNTSRGPTVILRCSKCQIIQDNLYISWHFVDLPNSPAAAVGFQFSLLAKSHASKKHVSSVRGLLKNGSSLDDTPVTFRGVDANVLKFNLFPRIYRNFHNLRLIQPLFREFLPGPSFHEINKLRASLESPNDGLLNMTVYVNLLSSYIVEIDNQNIMGPGR